MVYGVYMVFDKSIAHVPRGTIHLIPKGREFSLPLDPRRYKGFVTEKSGASLGTGSQQTIAHGLAFTPTAQQIGLFSGSAIANPYHSAAPDATNIYVTAGIGQAWYWATVGS
jgi:hypothetical protein